MKTKPEVFVIESLRFQDENRDRFEGKMITHILNLHEKRSQYFYIRTKKELKAVLKKFGESAYRYLHLSCHGNSIEMATTLDLVKFAELGSMLNPYLEKRRVFVSACEMVNDTLAKTIIPDTGCYSIIGPCKPIAFSDAAIFWSALYHLMFRCDDTAMKRVDLLRYIDSISKLLQVDISYFSASRSNRSKYSVKYFRQNGL
jgi:hypothetical protein